MSDCEMLALSLRIFHTTSLSMYHTHTESATCSVGIALRAHSTSILFYDKLACVVVGLQLSIEADKM